MESVGLSETSNQRGIVVGLQVPTGRDQLVIRESCHPLFKTVRPALGAEAGRERTRSGEDGPGAPIVQDSKPNDQTPLGVT